MSTDEVIAIAVQQGKLRQLAARHGGGDAGIGKAFRELVAVAHPDAGGCPIRFRRLVAARDQLLAHAAAVEAALCRNQTLNEDPIP